MKEYLLKQQTKQGKCHAKCGNVNSTLITIRNKTNVPAIPILFTVRFRGYNEYNKIIKMKLRFKEKKKEIRHSLSGDVTTSYTENPKQTIDQ